MKTSIFMSLSPGQLRLGLIEAEGLLVGPSSADYIRQIQDDSRKVIAPDFVYPDHLKKGIRSLLKSYGFHASGRNRPASEFLVKDMQARGAFNPISNVVDINNHLSLVYHLPISILDLDLTGKNLCIRTGSEDERYVFNPEGQELSLENLLVIARSDGDFAALGSPVKDSHATKISAKTVRALGVIYTVTTLTSEVELMRILERFSELLRVRAGATSLEWKIVSSQ